jgi:hypothetical protein
MGTVPGRATSAETTFLDDLIAWFEADGGPLYNSWEHGDLGGFDDRECDFDETLALVRAGAWDAITGIAVDRRPLALYRAALALQDAVGRLTADQAVARALRAREDADRRAQVEAERAERYRAVCTAADFVLAAAADGPTPAHLAADLRALGRALDAAGEY